MMEALSSSETTVLASATRRNILENAILHRSVLITMKQFLHAHITNYILLQNFW
jgi:hypothetical protein